MTDVVIDTKEMKELAVALKAVSAESVKAFYDSLKVGGEIVAAQARQNANAFPREYGGTTRIADSIVVKRRAGRVRVQAGGTSAPEAAPLEAGGLGGTFRHPVFGDRENWVSQKAHPYLVPAALTEEPKVVAIVNEAVVAAFRRLGF